MLGQLRYTDSVAVQHYLQVTNDHFTRAADAQFDSDGFDIDVDAIFEEAARNQAQSAQDSQELETTGSDNEKPQATEESGVCGQSRCKSLYDKYLSIHPRGVEQGAKVNGNSHDSRSGGAKSGVRRAPDARGGDRSHAERGTDWKNLPPEIKKLIATLLRPYKRTR